MWSQSRAYSIGLTTSWGLVSRCTHPGERARVKPREAREVAFSRVFAYNHAISRIRAKWREIATRDVIAHSVAQQALGVRTRILRPQQALASR